VIRAKNFETVSKFVKGMPRILWILFLDMVYIHTNNASLESVYKIPACDHKQFWSKWLTFVQQPAPWLDILSPGQNRSWTRYQQDCVSSSSHYHSIDTADDNPNKQIRNVQLKKLHS